MYRCCLHFYLVGGENNVFDVIKNAVPLENFTHEFYESDMPEKAAVSGADVIVADLSGKNINEMLSVILPECREGSELVLLADREQVPRLAEFMDRIDDIWVLPMTPEETAFRVLRRQQRCKLDRDHRQTEQYLDSTINNIPNLVWYKDRNGIHEKVNDSFCRTVNKTREQVQGRGHAYIWDVEQDDPACIESEREVMTKRQTCISEETIKTGEGERLLTTYKSPLYDFDGSVMGTVGFAVDITRERGFEQEIIKKNRSLEKIFTSIDCGVLCHSLDGSRIISVNSAALKILGYDNADELREDGFNLIAQSVLDEDKPKLRESIQSLQNEDDSVSVEYRVLHKDGTLLHVMGSIKLLRENGELFYQRFLLDCTAQKLQERQAEKRQAELINALGIDFNLVCYFDLDTGKGIALRVNDCQCGIMGTLYKEQEEFSIDDGLERYIDTCFYTEDKNMMRQVCSSEWLTEELEEQSVSYVNFRTVCNGKIQYFQMKAVKTGDWEKERGVVLGFRSFDDEIRTEIEQKNLLENALMQANRASKAKSAFLSNMSHDIRTPMNAIVGFTSLAMNHIDNREQVEGYLKKIMTSGNHLLSLINDVLDMSRIESGKMRLEERPCSLPEILHGLRNIIQGDVYAKQLELFMDTVDVYHEDILCDKLRLNQVLLNLLNNAVKYTDFGGTISIRITEKKGAPEGFAVYEFSIKDTGIGMSEEFIEHIFEPFERERNSTISGIQGTGLGMAITKNIVDMMGGTIEITSEQNVGTECIVNFMFRIDNEAEVLPMIPELQNCRALVVDDDFNTCDSVSYMLQQIGMRAEWTLSGKEAVLRTRQAFMRNDNYNVYIVDWLLPDVNGIEVVRRIRHETGEDVPVIILTAHDWSDIEEEAKDAGVTAFCSKPLFLSELRSCLNSIVSAGNAADGEKEEKIERQRSERILLAEDNELNQEIAAAILEEAGFKVEIAANGQIAVDMLKKSGKGYYQIVLMDVQMPVMNGYDAARAIRALEDEELASIPILAMTANAFEEDKQEALNSGMNAHIAKPIDAGKLIETLDDILG